LPDDISPPSAWHKARDARIHKMQTQGKENGAGSKAAQSVLNFVGHFRGTRLGWFVSRCAQLRSGRDLVEYPNIDAMSEAERL